VAAAIAVEAWYSTLRERGRSAKAPAALIKDPRLSAYVPTPITFECFQGRHGTRQGIINLVHCFLSEGWARPKQGLGLGVAHPSRRRVSGLRLFRCPSGISVFAIFFAVPFLIRSPGIFKQTCVALMATDATRRLVLEFGTTVLRVFKQSLGVYPLVALGLGFPIALTWR
jgi:hypothetical protein